MFGLLEKSKIGLTSLLSIDNDSSKGLLLVSNFLNVLKLAEKDFKFMFLEMLMLSKFCPIKLTRSRLGNASIPAKFEIRIENLSSKSQKSMELPISQLSLASIETCEILAA